MARTDIAQLFLNREPIAGVAFQHNDYVRVIAGAHAGKTGSLVTVLRVEPEPRYILELESGFDVEVLQSELQRADT
jgi:transcription elongation factor